MNQFRRGAPLPAGSGPEEDVQGGHHRLFFCVFPDPAACETIAVETDGLRVEHSLIGVPIQPNRLHATLHFLGEHAIEREDIVQAASQAAARVSHAPVEVSLSLASSFNSRGDRHPCVLMAQEERTALHGLWRELGNHLMAAGLGRYIKREFTPHVTVLYDTRLLAPQQVEAIRWEARDFSLVRSANGEYQVLGSWPLRRG